MEQNEPEMKGEEKSSGREDEIELKAQICENSMEQNEVEVKSVEKSYLWQLHAKKKTPVRL